MTKEIVKFFNDNSVIYDKKDVINARRLLAQYFYVVERMIPEIPRSVHFSSELSTNLTGMDSKWANFVQNIKQHFEDGRDVLKFLSKGALNARSQDGLLTDFGIHHLHLGNKRSESETFVERSDYLLFVFIESSNVYFLDLRRHPNANIPGDYGWSDQDYLKIMQSNWPEVLRKYSLKRATGTIVSDEQKKTLQELNINVISSFGGEAEGRRRVRICPTSGAAFAVPTELLATMSLEVRSVPAGRAARLGNPLSLSCNPP